MTNEAAITGSSAAEFAEFFARGIALGERDRFLEHFTSRMHHDARLRQPLSRAGYGPAGLRRLFTPLFAALPDLHGQVHRWGASGDGVLIEFTLRGTLGRRLVELHIVDRFVLRDGLIQSNDSYLNPLPLLPRLLAHPLRALRLLPRFVRTEHRPAT